MPTYDFVDFDRSFFNLYQDWFQHPGIADALGPKPDEDWLEYVLNQNNGRQFVVMVGEKMVAVVGLEYPDNNHPWFAITDFAVAPECQSRGIGTEILKQLLPLLDNLGHGKLPVVAFVDRHNVGAVRFFQKQGWQQKAIPSDDWDAFEFRLLRQG